METEPCKVCGLPLAIGQQGCIVTVRPHEPVPEYFPFIPYFDFALGEQVDSLAQRKRFMREKHMDYRDKMSPGDLSARQDRIHEQNREQRRG